MISRSTLGLALLSGCALLVSCRTAAPRASLAQPEEPTWDVMAAASRPRSTRDVLTGEEIVSAHASNAYDLIRRLRPQWLQMRGSASMPDPDGSREIQVWYNGRSAGSISVLRDYDESQIISIRWVDPITARSTYGPPNGRGVIATRGGSD